MTGYEYFSVLPDGDPESDTTRDLLPGRGVYRCSGCGALVSGLDFDLHNRFHAVAGSVVADMERAARTRPR